MRVIITGGEPLIDKNNLLLILSKLSDVKIGIVLASNGTLVDEDIASYLSGYLSAVQISLDGMKATHDSIKGIGNFDKAVKGIKHFLCNGILTQVNIIPTQNNIDEIIDVLYLCECLGVDRFHLFPLIPRGRGAEVYKNLSLDMAGIVSIYEKCLKTKLINGWNINIGLSRRHMVDGSCILVKPDGTVYSPSYVSSENQYAGNIETDSLLELWEKSKSFNKKNHLIQTNPYISYSVL
jgi:MoaA/NifB/PqqE/SkfB family radical SAM enzyme